MKRILFFHQGAFSEINLRVGEGLQKRFPAAEIRFVNVNHLLKKRPVTVAVNMGAACMDYGLDLLLRRRDFDDAFFGTRYLFEHIRRMALRVQAAWPADFSFQTQSMYDCSSPDRPHFVYTDHTYSSCREYPSYGTAMWTPVRPDWLIELERQIHTRATAVYTMGNNVRETLIRAYGLPPERVECVGAGCNADIERLTAIATPLERYEARNVLFIGREWERKGGPQLLEAFRRVRQLVPDATLTILGCRPVADGEGIQVIGPVSLDQVAGYYERASVFCMPSRSEPYGIVWLEAMAAGLPVIGLRLGSAPDFIHEEVTGRLVEPDDVDGLAGTMADVLRDPERARGMGLSARRLVLEQYTWDRVCSRMSAHMLASLGHRADREPTTSSATR